MLRHPSLSSKRELREYIFSLIEQAEATRKAADEKAEPLSYFRLAENLAEIVVITLHLRVLNKALRRAVPDAAFSHHSVHVPIEALQAFKKKWKEAQIEEEVIPRPNMITYHVSGFYNLAKSVFGN